MSDEDSSEGAYTFRDSWRFCGLDIVGVSRGESDNLAVAPFCRVRYMAHMPA